MKGRGVLSERDWKCQVESAVTESLCRLVESTSGMSVRDSAIGQIREVSGTVIVFTETRRIEQTKDYSHNEGWQEIRGTFVLGTDDKWSIVSTDLVSDRVSCESYLSTIYFIPTTLGTEGL